MSPNLAALALTESANILKDSWILDEGSDIHICNNALKWGFQITKQAVNREFVREGNSTIPIEAYGIFKVKVDTSTGKKHITLNNVALAHGFLTNIISMQLLNNHGLHLNSRSPTRLEWEDYSLACTLYQNGGHVLFKNLNDQTYQNSAFMARLTHNPKLRTLTEAQLHRIMSHASSEVISKINGPDYGINIDISDPTPKASKCVPCCLANPKNIISRRTGSEVPQSALPFHTLIWDTLMIEEAYNGDRYTSHFYCPDSHFNYTFSCKLKTEFKLSLRAVIHFIKNQWQRRVQVLRLDGGISMIEECNNLAAEHGIIYQTSAPDTPEQNGPAER